MIIMIEGEIYLRILLVNLSYNYSILILRVISVLGKFFVPQISTKYQKYLPFRARNEKLWLKIFKCSRHASTTRQWVFNYLLNQCIHDRKREWRYSRFRSGSNVIISFAGSIQGSQQVALPSRTYGNRVAGDAWIIYWDSCLVVLTCNFKAASPYEYLTRTFISPDAHDDPKRRLFHPGPVD